MSFIANNSWIIVLVVVIIGIIAFIGFLAAIYRVADIDKALIVTGGKEPVIKVSGGAFVIPIFRKASYFDLCMLTVTADKDEIKTCTAVPIVADWTAQIRPCVSDPDKLRTAIISFKERGNEGIIADVKLTLMGAVRDVVASMTPEAILKDKESFKQEIQKSVSDEMDNMGLELVSLNIQDVTDSNGYFDNIASLDSAEKDKAAKIKAAEVDQATREMRAIANKTAEVAEATAQKETRIAQMEAELSEKEKRKDTDLKIAEFKVATDIANADADVAGELRKTERLREVEQQKGAVEVMKAEQENLAAQKQREVVITRTEAEKEKLRIEAEAAANVKAIEVEATIKVAERKADAARKEAQGAADVETTKAEARVNVAERDAEAIKKTAEAEAAKTRAKGLADAEITQAKAIAEAEGKKADLLADAEGIKAQQLAEAEGIKAKKLAEAEGERALAEARAANEKVNFEIEKLKIQTEAQIKIATSTAEIMANIGQNAEFVNIGGGNIPGLTGGAGTGNSLLDTIMQVPALVKCLNVQNEALNGCSANEELAKLSNAAFSGLKSIKDDKKEESSQKESDVEESHESVEQAESEKKGEVVKDSKKKTK